jgi:superoxide reductase
MNLENIFQSANWRTEKKVSIIDCPDFVQTDNLFEVKISLGKEITRPQTIEHHIRWIHFFFKPDNKKPCYRSGNFGFSTQDDSTETSVKSVHTHHSIFAALKISKSGIMLAAAYRNINGL